MVRKRILRFEPQDDQQDEVSDEGGREHESLWVICPKNDQRYLVRVADRAKEIQEELGKLLQSSGA